MTVLPDWPPTNPAQAHVQRLLHDKECADRLLAAALESVPGYALVLNHDRRIVTANQRFLRALNLSPDSVVGRLPGDALFCSNASQSCGGSPSCQLCGMFQAIRQAERTQQVVTTECRLQLLPSLNAFEAEVVASPLKIDGKSFMIVTMRSVEAEKYRALMDRLFFHDILNTAGGIRGLVSVLRDNPPCETKAEYEDLLDTLAQRMLAIIYQHRDLVHAESGNLATCPVYVSIPAFLREMVAVYQRHDASIDRTIALGALADVDVVTDSSLARRVVENMLKNALEAIQPGETVTVSADDLGAEVAIRVHNPGVMDESVRHQLFQKSFSTKGVGRGIGAYSMRLFGERYLGGEIAFTSHPERGTTFVFQVPKTWRGQGAAGSW